jgi:RNA polymerase sigma factor (sigma-70 family)
MKLALNDEDVIRQYLKTSPSDCYETLYSRYVGKVYERCLHITRDSEKAQDYTHDIFIRMFSHLNRFEERSTFSTWLYSISYNYCMDQIRKASRVAILSLDDWANQYTYADDTEDTEHNFQQLARAMDSLPSAEATLLKLKYQDGLEVRQIATQLNIKDSAVKMRLKRTRDKVKQLVVSSDY